MTGDLGSVLRDWARQNARRLLVLCGLVPGPAPAARRLPTQVWAVVLVLVATLSVVLVAAGAPSGLRAPVVLGFLLLAPGWAFVRLLAIPDTAMRISVALALSISTVGLVTLIQAYSYAWDPTMMVVIAALITLVGVAIEIGRARREASR